MSAGWRPACGPRSEGPTGKAVDVGGNPVTDTADMGDAEGLLIQGRDMHGSVQHMGGTLAINGDREGGQ